MKTSLQNTASSLAVSSSECPPTPNPQDRRAELDEAIRAFARGDMLIVTDDNDRENEGDLVVAASKMTLEQMAFMVRHTSGIVCAPMASDIAKRLHLEPMVATNDSPHTTAFTVSVDYRQGLTTGISAEERTATVRALANPNVGAADFVRPGHVFPLIARRGGLLIRSGHTEAAVDLCRLADLPEVGVICELVNDDGTVKRGAQMRAFAAAHELKTVSIADLIAWRQRAERIVERVEEEDISTAGGPARAIAYRTPFDHTHHLAVVFGDLSDGASGVPVRLQRESVVEDAFGADGFLSNLTRTMAARGRGVIVYLREGAVGVARSQPVRPDRDGASGRSEAHASARAREEEWREIGLGAQILKDLGVTSICLLASRARRYVGLEGFGITIEKTELI